MSSKVDARPRAALRRAAVRATLAPSVHNSQPWSMFLDDKQLDFYADRGRQLKALDSTGRQLTISCGGALFNARACLTAAGFDVRFERVPNAVDRDLIASLTPIGGPRPQTHSIVSMLAPAGLSMLDPYIEGRHTNRHRFTDDDVPIEVLEILRRAVASERCQLVVVDRHENRAGLAAIDERAGADLKDGPTYRAEAAPGRDVSRHIVSATDGDSVRTELGPTMTPQVVLRIGRAPASLASRRRRLVDELHEEG